ncbi:MAG TPA: hypothetical protein VKG85_08460 [Actinomycetes bacterium]|nr:hypothetical protein [Actinomycetes bacterium]
MADQTTSRRDGPDDAQVADVPLTRSRLLTLLAANPNYFGNLEGSAFSLVEPKAADSTYEEIGCVAYSPERDRLEATIVIKRSYGYTGGPCESGSLEYVRFFVQYGSGSWIDAGMTAARVHDLPAGTDCAGESDHPVVHVAGLVHTPDRKSCISPVLPRVRAILSWQIQPPAGDPNYVPIWGEVQEARIQIRPRTRLYPPDIVDLLKTKLEIDPGVFDELVEIDLSQPIPEPDPIGPVALNPQPLPPQPPEPGPPPYGVERLVRLYRPDKLRRLAEHVTDPQVAELVLDPPPAHRLAAHEALQATTGALAAKEIESTAKQLDAIKIDWLSVLSALSESSGNTTYEELECLGLDNTAGQLVATYRIKRPTGYSGPPCSAGSKQYVAFWADWDDDCRWTYLGTVAAAAHDYVTIPAEGLSYAVVLPVDLGSVRRLCDEPGLHRIRAVLSWNAPPSTIDPDAVPYWGNRLDTHVHVLPGPGYNGTARLTIVGGVATDEIDPATGVTKPVAHIAYNGLPLDNRGCPFAGRVTVHGPTDPALAGTPYRLAIRNVTTGGPLTPVLTPFFVVDSNGVGSFVTPNPANGSVLWPTWSSNTLGTLGYIDTYGDDVWEVVLEIGTAFNAVDTQRYQLDNTLNTASIDPANAAHLTLDSGQPAQQGCGKFTAGMTITGRYDARDRWFGSWSFGLLPFAIPTGALTTSVPLATSEAPIGSTWALNTSGLQPCGYVLRLYVSDRAVVNSSWTGRTVAADVGFCLD